MTKKYRHYAACKNFFLIQLSNSRAGADMADISLFKEYIGDAVRIKAAGGIRTKEDMEAFLGAGCDRIGSSAAAEVMKEK